MLPARDTATALRHLATAVDADRGAFLYLDRGDGILELAASVRDGRVAASAEAVPDADHNGRGGILGRLLPAGLGGTRTVARLRLPDPRGGLLVLERRRREPFSEADLALARVEARQLVPRAVTRLGPRPVAWPAQLEAVQSVAAQLTRMTTVEEVSATLCTQLHRVAAFDDARVYVMGEDGVTLDLVAFRPHAPEYEGESADGLRVRVGEGITGWVAFTGQMLNVPDAANHPRALDVPGTLALPEESMLLAPLRSEGRVIGVVVLARLGLDRFTEDDLRLLGVLADQAAVAMENARLHAARERHVAELGALLEISLASNHNAGEAELASGLAQKLASAGRVDGCVISRGDDATASLRCLGRSGFVDGVGDDGCDDVPLYRSARQVLLADAPRSLDPEREDLDPTDLARCRALGATSLLLLPLSTGGQVKGLIELVSRSGQRVLRADEMSLLRAMAHQIAAELENARLVRQLRDAAEIDLVTGVYSHRHLQERIRQETARAARTRSPLSVLMLDLDDFKLVNDRFGHQAGDRVLRAIASCLRDTVRANDIVARYGGDEFVVLMPDTGEGDAHLVAERTLAAVAALSHPMADRADVRVGCSAGLALHPRDGRSGKSLLRFADAAMYTHKRARDRALVAEPRPRSEPVTDEDGSRIPAASRGA